MSDNRDKKIFVTKTFLPPMEEYIEEIKPIWESSWVTNNGVIHKKLEGKLKEYLHTQNSSLFCNGHLALDLAIKSLKLTGEVITTPFTFASTTHAIVMNNLTPVFCDINLDDYTIDCDKIEGLITEKTSAIIPVHVFGQPCNTVKIEEIARKYNLKVIYDAAHAFGVEVDGIGIGNFGDISMFSLHATKVYNSIEGGVLTYSDSSLEPKLRMLKNFGIVGEEEVQEVGLNAKMNEFQAAMGVVNIRYVDTLIKNRAEVVHEYIKGLSNISGIRYLKEKDNVKHNYSYFPILIDEQKLGITRNEICERLKNYNVFSRKYFYPMVTGFECYKGKYNDVNLINAKYATDRILCLPIHGELSIDEVKKIVNAIIKIINSSSIDICD